MFMQVFIKCGRLLHYGKAYVKYFRENSSHCVERSQVFFAKREGTFCECASSRRLMVLPLAEFFHADFVSLASEHPPIDVPEPGRMSGAAAMLPQRNQVALFQCHDEFAAVATVTVFVKGQAPDSFV